MDVRELAVQRRNNLADSLSSTSGRRNNVVVDAATAAPVLGGGAIYCLLGSRGSVDGAHQALNYTEFVVDDLGQGSQAVGRTRGVGDLVRDVDVIVSNKKGNDKISKR